MTPRPFRQVLVTIMWPSVRYMPPINGASGRVYINRDQYFEGVAPETWQFTIGGYRPAEKWLKDRQAPDPVIRRHHLLPPNLRHPC